MMTNYRIVYFVLAIFSIFVFNLFITKYTYAQAIRTDGGMIIVEDRILSPNFKQIVFVVNKNLTEESTLDFQTVTLDGVVHNYPQQRFLSGLSKGQVIQIWNGDFNIFETTPWLRFDIVLTSGGVNYYTSYSTPIASEEQYKEPMIVDIKEVQTSPTDYYYLVTGNFDKYQPTTIIINNNLFVSSKSISYPKPAVMQFSVSNANRNTFPKGKFLLTICQYGKCDTLMSRHR